MRVLEFRVRGQEIVQAAGSDFSGIVRGTQGYLKARFFSTRSGTDAGRRRPFLMRTERNMQNRSQTGFAKFPQRRLKAEVFPCP